MEKLEKKSIAVQNHMYDSVTHDQITVTMAQPLYMDNMMNSQKLLMVQKMPLNMMQLTY